MNGANKPPPENKRYWFPAKTYGWGWGSPTTWQGWVVIGSYILLLLAGTALLDPQFHVAGFLLYAAGISGAFVYICWRTGEPPRWRWGKKKNG
jgi:hypothetical protein